MHEGRFQVRCGGELLVLLLFSRELQLTNAPGEPRFPIAIAQLGNVGSILPGFDETLNKSASKNTLDGAGGGLERKK